MRLTPVETVVSRLSEDAIIEDVRGDLQAAVVWIDGRKYLVTVVKLPTPLEVN